ncbi:MAG: ABC transporter ATP-binding protein [Cytophagales bacterium]
MSSTLDKDIILKVSNLKTYFYTDEGVVKSVDDIGFELKRGETLGIVGESGSGKSITSLSIMRLIGKPGKITDGEIIFESKNKGIVDLTKISEKEMLEIRGNDIAMIFQEPMTSLNPVFTCGNQVAEAIMLHQKVTAAEAKTQTIELFKKVLLPRPEIIFDSYPHQLSGGQKQRVMIAMALSCNPKVLIADEPTTALDVTVQATVLELLSKLRDEYGMSIIFITHDLGVIAEFADRVMVMYRGKQMETGRVVDIFDDAKHPYTKGLLACRPRLDIKLKRLPVVSDFMDTDEDGKITVSEKQQQRTVSAGSLIMQNYITEDEINERNTKLQSQKPILQIKNLKTYFPIKKGLFSKTVDYVKAIDDVSFDVYPGEIVGLVGESGCGKTTLGRSILRLVEPTSGEIIFDNQNILDLKKNEMRNLRKDMQIIFQDPYSSLNPKITVGESILEPMRIHGIFDSEFARKKYAIELLETVNLRRAHFNRYPAEFSGGQRQRICIARALALKPKFIICDESVSALDVSVQAQVLNLINDIKDEFNFTTIFISHDLSVVKFIADRVIVMQKGVIVEQGFSDELYKNPKEEYTKKLITAIPKATMDNILKHSYEREAKLKSFTT